MSATVIEIYRKVRICDKCKAERILPVALANWIEQRDDGSVKVCLDCWDSGERYE